MRAGASAYLLKSMPKDELLDRVALRSDAAEPVPRSTLRVGHRQHADLVFLHEEDERIGEAGKQCPPDLEVRVYVLKARKGTRAGSHQRENRSYLL